MDPTPQTDGGQEQAFFDSLPRAVLGASVVLRDTARHVLLVEPTYQEHWVLPGGTVEHNEAPHDAAVREVAEELTLTIRLGQLLVVDWAHGEPENGRPPYVHFVFDGGRVTESMLAAVELPPEELRTWAPCTLADAERLMRPRASLRLRNALGVLDERLGPAYCVDGDRHDRSSVPEHERR